MIQYVIEINPWEKLIAIDDNERVFKIGDYVVASTEFGNELGKISETKEIKKVDETNVNRIEKMASDSDLDLFNRYNQNKEGDIEACKEMIKNFGLDMKVVDCHYSLDGQRLSFAFIADGRIDFRELVKELGRHFGKVIRLHQMGVRDEAKVVGDIGSCGETQCCRSHLKKLGNVTSEFAEDQQIVHRGSERLSGICGRLKCCLAYEEEHYQELIKKLPPVGTRVKTVHGRGVVIGWHVLKCSVDVKLDPSKQSDKPVIVEVPIKN
jgi:cell fate regulator YaaT (PSP1 superfamily)